MIVRIDHIGIAVNSIEDAAKLYSGVGLKIVGKIESSEVDKIKVAMIPVGESKIELMESTDPEGAIAKFIAKRGEGIHHLAIGVSNITDELETLKRKGVPLVDMEPRIAVGGHRIAFLHPKATKILLELVEV